MSAVKLNNIYEGIEHYTPAIIVQKSVQWRDANPTIARKVVCGASLFVSGLAGLVDAVASIALAILSSPLELAGLHFARSFLKRTLFESVLSGMHLTVNQFDNLCSKNLNDCIAQQLKNTFG
jgi:hypothetical protein